MKAGVRRYFRPEVDRLRHHPEETGDLARPDHLHAGREVDKDRLDRDSEAREDDRAGQRRRASRRAKHHFLAAQVFEGADVRACRDVQLGDGQANDVLDARVQVGRLALRTKVLKDIRLGECDVDATQVEQVLQVGRGAARYSGQHAQLVAVVEHFSEFVGEAQIGAVHVAARNADRPVVLALFEYLLSPALLKTLRNVLPTDY